MSPIKEPHYFCHNELPTRFTGPGDEGFNFHITRDLQSYQDLFSDATGYPVVGEASVYYLTFPETANRIREVRPDARIVMVLRNPVDRAYSAYLHTRRDGREDLDFSAALAAESQRRQQGYQPLWWYRQAGFYAASVQHYLSVFGAQHVQIFLYEDLQQTDRVMQKILHFLGASTQVKLDTRTRYNTSGRVKSRFWYNFFDHPNGVKELLKPLFPVTVREHLGQKAKAMTLQKESIPMPLRKQLRTEYQEDIINLQDVIGRDLSHWMEL
jgi:hypothetical protein